MTKGYACIKGLQVADLYYGESRLLRSQKRGDDGSFAPARYRFEGDAERAEAVYRGMHPLTPADVADAVVYCATRPPHVNISEVVLMPVDQSSATLVRRDEAF